MSHENVGLNILVDQGPVRVHTFSTAILACLLLIPQALLAFLVGVGGACLWIHESRIIARDIQ